MKSKNELEMEDERKDIEKTDCWSQGIFMVIQQHL